MIRVLHRRGIFFFSLGKLMSAANLAVVLASHTAGFTLQQIERAWLCSHVSMVQQKCNAHLQKGGFSKSTLGESWMMGLVNKTTRAAFRRFIGILALILKLACSGLPGMPPRAVFLMLRKAVQTCWWLQLC